ncbi:MAG: phosphohistidine phosphatase SixA [Myxococcota bacterium]
MRLVLLRHGIAEDSAPAGDAKRALTNEGRKKVHDVCEALAGMDLGIERILSSPLVRAAQTAQILREVLKLGKVEESNALLPEAQPSAATSPIRALKASCVALVGHEPHLGRYTAWSVGGGQFDIRKSGVVILEGSGLPGPGGGAVVGLFAPRHLRPLV